MFLHEVKEIKVHENDGNPQTVSNGRIIKVLRENPPLIKGDPWTFIVLTEKDLSK